MRMGKCPKCGKKTTSWLELEYCDMCYTEDELNSYKLLDEIDWLKQKIFRTQYDCDQCQARHIKDKDDLEAKLAESEKKIETLKQKIKDTIHFYSDDFVEKDKELKELRYKVRIADQSKTDFAIEQIINLKNMLADRAELIQCGQVAEFMFTTYDLEMCSQEILNELKKDKYNGKI